MREEARRKQSRYETEDIRPIKEGTVKVGGVFYMLMVQDMERGVCFYLDVMGLDVKDHTPEWSNLALGDAIVILYGGGSNTLLWSGLHFEVENIQDACLRVQEGGGRVPSWPRHANGWTLVEDRADTERKGLPFIILRIGTVVGRRICGRILNVGETPCEATWTQLNTSRSSWGRSFSNALVMPSRRQGGYRNGDNDHLLRRERLHWSKSYE